jgi:hypothetical protein
MNPLLLEGLTDAGGFVAGALLGFAIAHLLGLDPMAPGYSTRTMIGIALLGIGGGAGLHLARRWRAGRRKES